MHRIFGGSAQHCANKIQTPKLISLLHVPEFLLCRRSEAHAFLTSLAHQFGSGDAGAVEAHPDKRADKLLWVPSALPELAAALSDGY